jgi:putative heme-binding domain-containing protein
MKWTLLAALVLSLAQPVHAQPLELKKDDHICIIGNTLADRMQHSGWLETLIHTRFPEHNLVFRNLGFSGDELTMRLRSMDFGTPDQWLAGSAPIPQPGKLNKGADVRQNRFELTNTKADVVFAFFGYNESFAGETGLSKFKQDLEAFIKHTQSMKYNGKSPPRLVLFSPIGFEDHNSLDLPDGRATNQRLQLYTAAMADVARANDVPFVDLCTPTLALYQKADKRLTINGIHLNERGDKAVAQVIAQALFGAAAAPRDNAKLEKLRAAVNDKNFYFYNHYRAVDGYSTFGDRAFLRFVGGQTNYEVVQRELEAIDVMTANRDKVVWAAARGKDIKPDDSNLPTFVPVITNKPGTLPGGKHLFLSGQEAISKMTLGKGMKINLFASEEMFPELSKPVQMAWDTKGRLWVAAWPSYPHWKPGEEMNDKLIILEDTDGDGKADKMTVFADHLHNPTGFEFYNGGVLVAQAPDLLFLKDTSGGDKANVRERVLHGLDTADTHHTSNSFTLDPGGAIYFQEGTFHQTQVETPYGPVQRCSNAGVFRYEPRTQKFEVYVSFGFANPHGHVFDQWGRDTVVDGTGSNPFDAALFSGRIDYPQKHGRPPQVYQQRTRPCPGVELLSSRHFPKEMQNDFLVGNVIGFQGILRYKIEDRDSSFVGTEQEPIVSSTDPNFRPSDIKIGPDGAIYFLDWQNPIIGHMQHNLRDPSRDRLHGRIYRVTYEGRPLLTPAKIAGEPVTHVLDLLKEPEARVRYRAKIELGGRPTDEVIAAVKQWTAGLDKSDPNYEHQMMEALWVHQYHNVVDQDLLKRMLTSPNGKARAAATRVLCYWRDRVPDALAWLKRLAADSQPRVRLEAVRAASFFTIPEAIEVPIIAAELPSDEYLDFLRGETLRVLEPQLRTALAQGKDVQFTTDAGARYFLRSISTEKLLKMEKTRMVNLELLLRPGLREEDRREALRGLARMDNLSEPRVLLHTIAALGEKTNQREESVLFDLVRLLTGRSQTELASVRADIEKLATTARLPVLRQIGFVILVTIDGSAGKAWSLATKSVASLQDLVNAVPLIGDAGLRASLYPRIEPLLKSLPPELASHNSTATGTLGRFVRVEIIGRNKTLTLAEVEAYSDGRNIARQGKASQSSTAHGGDAKKAIDGNTSGKFNDGGQTHTQENSLNPWWEVDLGDEYPLDKIVVYNRTDDGLGKRLEGFTIRVLNAKRQEVYVLDRIPAPKTKSDFPLGGGGSAGIVRRLAMNALTSVRGQELHTFQTLAQFIRDDIDRGAAIRAAQRIPKAHWPKDEAAPLLDIVLGFIRKIPAAQRTTPTALDALEFADALASLLPAADAKKIRAELGELGVRVIRLATLPERMSYDKEIIVVKAGKPVEFVFENTDLMPHNFVIAQPGSMEEIGQAAEAGATQPGAAERHYVPNSAKILLSSTLLQPRESQQLSFTAPTQAGVYPYVCTYPGHWRRMYGALYVVDDLDQYQASPDAYLAMHPLAIKDELLKEHRPRTEWKYEDLASAVEGMKSGRSWGSGKQMFTVGTCIACHKLDNVGVEFGPDLTKLDPKLKPVDILKDIVEPSFRINEKYQSYVFELKSGKQLTGIILAETADAVKIIENPLAKAEPLILKPSDIESRQKSPISMMPKGLLDKLTREEILDLIAYIASRGDKNHELFKGEQHHHGH